MATYYEQLCDESREDDRRELLARAEAQILESIGDAHAEQMARGEICRDCGQPFAVAQGRLTACRDCGGSVRTGEPVTVAGRVSMFATPDAVARRAPSFEDQFTAWYCDGVASPMWMRGRRS